MGAALRADGPGLCQGEKTRTFKPQIEEGGIQRADNLLDPTEINIANKAAVMIVFHDQFNQPACTKTGGACSSRADFDQNLVHFRHDLTQPFKQLRSLEQRQTDNIGVGSDNFSDKSRSLALNGVTARLAVPFIRCDVGVNIALLEPPEGHCRTHQPVMGPTIRANDCQAAQNPVATP